MRSMLEPKKTFDLEERTFQFARDVRLFLKHFPKTMLHLEDIKQVLRSSASIGANDIEAREALSKKDFYYRIKLSRKEAKETIYWMRLIASASEASHTEECLQFANEAKELMHIFGAIISKMSKENV